MSSLQGQTVAILLAEGVEDLEFHVTRMRLIEEGADVIAAAVNPDEVRGKNGLAAKPDALVGDVDPDALLAIVIPGGWAPDKLRRSEEVLELVRAVHAAGKPVGIICHGGGAFSGKDPSKVDRSAAYAARYVAKNVVAAGLAERCEVQVAYAIGVAHPVSVMVETFGTEHVARSTIAALIDEHFDLRPGAFREYLNLHRPIYQKTAAYGHFGREDADFTWERTDKVDRLRQGAGLDQQPEPASA